MHEITRLLAPTHQTSRLSEALTKTGKWETMFFFFFFVHSLDLLQLIVSIDYG